MKTIKTYECECGEDFYEDDGECINCGANVEPEKFREIEAPEVREVKLAIQEKKKNRYPEMNDDWHKGFEAGLNAVKDIINGRHWEASVEWTYGSDKRDY